MSWRTMKTVGLLNSKETVSKILRIFWTDLHWTGGGGGGEEERQCWVCFASEEDDPVAAWVHPCLCKGTTKWVHQVWHFRVEHAHCKSFVGLYPTLGGWETEREQQHGCCVSSMWRWLYHTGCNSPDIWILDISKWFSLSFPPLRLFFDFLMPWISWCVSVSKKTASSKTVCHEKITTTTMPGRPIVPGCCWWSVCGVALLDLRHIWGSHSHAGMRRASPLHICLLHFFALGGGTFWRVDLDGECRPPPSPRLSSPCAPWTCPWQDGQCLYALMTLTAWPQIYPKLSIRWNGRNQFYISSEHIFPTWKSPGWWIWVASCYLTPTHISHILKMPKHYLWSLEWEHSGIFSLPLPQHPSQRAAPVPPLFHHLLILCLWPGVLNGLYYLLSNNPFFARTFCGALFFPTIATFLGSTLFEEVKASIQGYLTICGCYLFNR